MTPEQKNRISEYVSGFHLPRYREIPDLGLHLEQVTKYVNRYVPGPITGSMVSNYVKLKVIPGPEKKSYYPDSIAYLIFVSYIKNVMTMEDIRLLVDIQKNTYTLEDAYNYFCDEFENLLQYITGLKPAPEPMGKTQSPEKDLLRSALLSITYKVYLDQLLILIRKGESL